MDQVEEQLVAARLDGRTAAEYMQRFASQPLPPFVDLNRYSIGTDSPHAREEREMLRREGAYHIQLYYEGVPVAIVGFDVDGRAVSINHIMGAKHRGRRSKITFKALSQMQWEDALVARVEGIGYGVGMEEARIPKIHVVTNFDGARDMEALQRRYEGTAFRRGYRENGAYFFLRLPELSSARFK